MPQPQAPSRPEDLDTGRRKMRRKLARGAAYLIGIQAALLWGTLLWHPERAAVAAAFADAWPVLAGTQAALLAVVLGYLGASTAEKVMAK